MEFDSILAGGLIVDGSGAPGYRGDLGIIDDRIAAIGDLAAQPAAIRIDVSNRVVAPGFIDIHTHYDPQVLWDAELTPSSWFGVTSVVMGNCGFTIAPLPPAARETCIQTLGNTEAMSLDALHAGITWDFESFGEYLRAVERRRPALNFACFVGHTALRLACCDDPMAPAGPADVARLQAGLEQAMAEGAWGFSTSRSPSHLGPGGRPVPSRVAEIGEFEAMGAVLRHARAGVFQGVQGPGLGIADFARIARACGRPVTWTSLHQGVDNGRHWEHIRTTQQERETGGDLWAQMSCVPITAQFTLAQPYLLNSVPALGQISGVAHAQRLAILADPAWQKEAVRQFAANEERRSFQVRFDRIFVAETKQHPELIGRSIADIAGDADPMACFIELSRAEDLQTRFRLIMFNYDDAELGRMLREPGTIVGLGDGGAHASQLCDATYCLHLLGHFSRARGDLALEQAVWRLTGQPADVFGIAGRGRLAVGNFADICVFDPATVDEGNLRRVHDLPAGADRLIADPLGIEHVLVNGTFIRRDGTNLTGTGAGRLLRPN